MNLTFNEINAQYDALAKAVELFDNSKAMLDGLMKKTSPKKILFTGCGSSFSLSCNMRSIASMRAPIPVYAVASGDLWLNCERYANMLSDALVISVSRSGRTSEVLNAYKAVKALNVNTSFLSIVCASDTPLGDISDAVIEMPWAFDESVCQTRCVSTLFAMGAMVVGHFFGDPSMREGFVKMSELGPDYLKRVNDLAVEIAAKDWDHAVVLADGEIDGIAEEGALAFKEISQLNSNYYHILDVRHGPMVKICEKTLVIIAVKSPADAYENALVNDVLAKGAHTVLFSQLPLEKEGAECISLGEEVGFVAYGLGLVNICQLTSYQKSKIVGCDPDAPTGLDAWIKIG